MLLRPPHQYPLDCEYQQAWSPQLFEQQLSSVADHIPLQPLDWPELHRRGIKAYLRRDDLLPLASGNKFYKLYYNLLNARQQGCKTLVSFGGAYSNHIYALAAASKALGFKSVGIIRGYKPKKLSPTLSDAASFGMKIHFLGKKDYGLKDIRSLLPILKQMHGDYYLIPEGGENLAGVRGCIEIARSVSKQIQSKIQPQLQTQPQSPYTLCSAMGTGATFAGLIAGSSNTTKLLGISVLKGEDKLSPKVSKWLELLGLGLDPLEEETQWDIQTGFHHGGYARVSPELLRFMSDFEARNNLLLDPVYTVKMLWAIEALAKKGYWSKGSQVVAIHSGGLQGRRGFELPVALQ